MIENEIEDVVTVSQSLVRFSSVGSSGSSCSRNLMIRNNHSDHTIAYKIRTNNLRAISALPNFGYIKPNSFVSLKIKTQLIEPFHAKLMISYGDVGERPGDFKDVWSGIDSGRLKNKQVRVERVRQQERQEKEGLGDRRENGQRMYVESRGVGLEIRELNDRLQRQQRENRRVREQLLRVEERMRVINGERLQRRVNESIMNVCQEYHTSYTTFLIFGVGIFVIGYVIALWGR